MNLFSVIFIITVYCLPGIICPPVIPQKEEPKEGTADDIHQAFEGYSRYLKEIQTALESDPEFRKRMENTTYESIQKGDIAQHLEFVSHEVRTKLDEIKRTEINRLREIAKYQLQLVKANGTELNKMRYPMLEHLDLKNPHSFEMKDLEKLVKQATADLEKYDEERAGKFKDYEMQKEHERRKKLKTMDEEHRKKAEAEYQESKKKHHQHEKVHEPGSRAQLEETWEKEDHMDKDTFNPKTFFKYHDTNEDGVLEPDEVEALFQAELDKVYESNHTEDDMMERYEEMNRMRQHVYKDYDKNKDSMISLEEFLDAVNSNAAAKDEGWKGIDDEDQFTEDELADWEKKHPDDDENAVKADGDKLKVQPKDGAAASQNKDGVVNMQQGK
ncbi:nucleobindin-2-like isoform X3 [Tubulanus polymorphus]|uniref:nucleobindin-2-like isoform X3 n=1 Tax=Tubulanus polymorphus TaxID=672921 RepID=UPI003DA685D1